MILNEIFNRFGKTTPPQLLHTSGGDWRVDKQERRAGDHHQPAVPIQAASVAKGMVTQAVQVLRPVFLYQQLQTEEETYTRSDVRGFNEGYSYPEQTQAVRTSGWQMPSLWTVV